MLGTWLCSFVVKGGCCNGGSSLPGLPGNVSVRSDFRHHQPVWGIPDKVQIPVVAFLCQ